VELLSEKPLFILVILILRASPTVIRNILDIATGKLCRVRFNADEIGCPVSSSGLVCLAALFCRWEFYERI